MEKLNKIKKTNSEIVLCEEVKEPATSQATNYGIYYQWTHKTGVQNSYKEVRALTIENAVDRLLKEVGSRHKLKNYCIKILRTKVLTHEELESQMLINVNKEGFKVPILNKKYIPIHRALKSTISKQ